MSSLLDWISFFHIPREWNGVVDILEKWASEKRAGWDISGREDLPAEYGRTFEQLMENDRI